MKEGVVFNFEGGRIRTIDSGAIAGNAAMTLGPGTTGKRWRVLYGFATGTMDATVATRRLRIEIRDAAGNVLSFLGVGDNMVSTNTFSFSLNVIQAQNGAFAPGETAYSVNMSATPNQNLYINETDVLRLSLVNGVAGDTFRMRLKVVEVAI